MASEEKTMHEELTAWMNIIQSVLVLAREMQSHEQDVDFSTTFIGNLFTKFEVMQPDKDGVAARYGFDIEHPDNPDYKLAFEFKAYFEGGKHGD